MTQQTVRLPLPADLPRLAEIEDAADTLFLDLVGHDAWERATPGEDRAAMPGFLLVAAETADGDAVGFAHVLEIDGEAHLEQLAVDPAHARQGYGRSLVEAAKVEASRRGYDRLTLRTYADVAWNAPFYVTCGFVETEPATPLQHRLVEVEERIGLGRHGRRVLMESLIGPSTLSSSGARR